MKRIILALALASCQPAHALMCEATTTSGEKVYQFVGTPTKSLSGTLATLRKCAQPYTITIKGQVLENVRLEPNDIRGLTVVETQEQLPEDRNAFIHESCKRTLDTVCDPAYGGIKLFTNPSVENGVIQQNCIGVTIKSGTPVDSQVTYYAFPSMYSAVNPDGTCRFDKE